MEAIAPKAVIPPHAFLFDLIHYARKIKPAVLDKTQKWPLGATLRPDFLHSRFPTSELVQDKYDTAIAPSLASAVKDFTSHDCFKTNLNLFNPSEQIRVDLTQEAWKSIFETTCVQSQSGFTNQIPVCTVEHDNDQLKFNRVSKTTGKELDLCCYGQDCDALKVRGALGPLQRFLLPSEQVVFDETGEVSNSICI